MRDPQLPRCRDPVWYLKKEADWLGWGAAIDAVGCEARGSAMQRALGVRPFKLQAGSATAIHWAIDAVRKGGVVSIIGAYGPAMNMIPIGDAVNKGLTLRMNRPASNATCPAAPST